MKSKYSITDEDHIYYDLTTNSENTLNSFVNWISTVCSKYEVGENYVKINESTMIFDEMRDGVILFRNGNQSYDFWWNKNLDNVSVKEKVKNLLGI